MSTVIKVSLWVVGATVAVGALVLALAWGSSWLSSREAQSQVNAAADELEVDTIGEAPVHAEGVSPPGGYYRSWVVRVESADDAADELWARAERVGFDGESPRSRRRGPVTIRLLKLRSGDEYGAGAERRSVPDGSEAISFSITSSG